MQISKSVMRSEEQISLRLRELYRRRGFSCYKMGKFEEYDLYARNKDFLVSDQVITFNDTNGKLMALKPDVTLSIVKNLREGEELSRLYYNESVYRISEKTHAYKEIMQTGVEALGNLSQYHLLEVIALAAESLQIISDESVLNLSHLGILSAILSRVFSEKAKRALLECVKAKNAHEIATICKHYEIEEKTQLLLQSLCTLFGEPNEVIPAFRALSDDPMILKSLDELEEIAVQLKKVVSVPLRIDLSLVNDINYYNGFVFQGYIEGIPAEVLSGGQYDKLMAKMSKKGGAIGFAVYLDLLERMKDMRPYDVDVLLVFPDGADVAKVYQKASQLVFAGKSVSVQNRIPASLSYREVIEWKEEE